MLSLIENIGIRILVGKLIPNIAPTARLLGTARVQLAVRPAMERVCLGCCFLHLLPFIRVATLQPLLPELLAQLLDMLVLKDSLRLSSLILLGPGEVVIV